MSKYFAVLCTLIVLTACSSTPGTVALNRSQDGIIQHDNNQDRLGWNDEGEDTIAEDDDVIYTDDTGTDEAARTLPLKLYSCTPRIPTNLNGGKEVNCELRAEGGSGTYEWSTEDLPDWLRLDQISDNNVVIVGTVPYFSEDKLFSFKVRVSDAENPSNKKTKSYFGKVKAFLMTHSPSSGTLSYTERFRIKKAQIKVDSNMKDLKSGETNVASIDEKVEMLFQVSGGKAPYTWRFEGIALDGEEGPMPSIIDESGHSHVISILHGDAESLNVSGVFGQNSADLYCKKADGTQYYQYDPYVICKDVYGIGAIRIYKTSLKVSVTDKDGKTASARYEFELIPPGFAAEPASNIFAIEAKVSGHDCGSRGCFGYVYLYGKDGLGREKRLGNTGGFMVKSMGWSSSQQVMPFAISEDSYDIKLEDITKIRIEIWDWGMGDYGEMWLDWLIIYTKYHYMFIDLQDRPLGGEVDWDYDTYASRLLSDVSSAAWQLY